MKYKTPYIEQKSYERGNKLANKEWFVCCPICGESLLIMNNEKNNPTCDHYFGIASYHGIHLENKYEESYSYLNNENFFKDLHTKNLEEIQKLFKDEEVIEIFKDWFDKKKSEPKEHTTYEDLERFLDEELWDFYDKHKLTKLKLENLEEDFVIIRTLYSSPYANTSNGCGGGWFMDFTDFIFKFDNEEQKDILKNETTLRTKMIRPNKEMKIENICYND